MRYRLTKPQIKMLLDGKTLTAGNLRFEAKIDDASREKITKLMEAGELPGIYALFIDDRDNALYLEDAK